MTIAQRLALLTILLAFGCKDDGSIDQPCRQDGTCKGRLVCTHVAQRRLSKYGPYDGVEYRCMLGAEPPVAKPNEDEDGRVMNAALAAAMTAAMMCH